MANSRRVGRNASTELTGRQSREDRQRLLEAAERDAERSRRKAGRLVLGAPVREEVDE